MELVGNLDAAKSIPTVAVELLATVELDGVARVNVESLGCLAAVAGGVVDEVLHPGLGDDICGLANRKIFGNGSASLGRGGHVSKHGG